MTDNSISLAEFAAAEAPPTRCLLCNVHADVEAQARDGKAAGVTYRTIGEWLKTIGVPGATKGRLERHFQEEHVHPTRRTDLKK